MSIRVMTQVWDTSQQKGSALLLLLALADHAADDGFCWPGLERLAKKIRMSTRSVSRLLQKLEDDKDLYAIRRNGEHNWYVVRVGMSDQDVNAVLKKRHFDTLDILSPVTPVSLGEDIATPEPMTQQCPPNLHEPSLNRQEEPPLADSPPVEDPLAITGAFFPDDTLQLVPDGADVAFDIAEAPETVEFWPEGETPPPTAPQEPVEQRVARLRNEYHIKPRENVAVPLEMAKKVAQNRAAVANPDWTVPVHRGLSKQCAVFKEATGYSPIKAARPHIDSHVMANTGSLQFWEEVCTAWILCGWSPKNVKGMLDYYVTNKIPTTKKANGGASGGRNDTPQVDQAVAETMDRLFDERGVRIRRE